ncbi:hypothetical protein LRS06_08535 [Hymenobacter sp. J193]|uniref:hypothetical protein n=1 Tax=Hymenobacter sp. J193 TaxID=2898429 RepID=UPI002151106C|nr:hypothetical protein [Hymenobacter sp. J193]MCR5887824.1 hypothetical protein [Hymenobacter sp. J193]
MALRRSLLAGWLLLCFLRVLLPEAWVLQLHAHEHTTEETASAQPGKKLVSPKHQHCPVDQFHHVPFQLAPPLELPVPFYQYVAPATEAVASVGRAATVPTAYLRGPPARA